MKRFALVLIAVLLFSCASTDTKEAAVVYSDDSLTLDEAVTGAGEYFVTQLPENARTALVSFDAPTGMLADYVLEELWKRFEDSKKLIMIERRNLEQVRAEMDYQYSGEVNMSSARSIGKQYGADIIVYGQMKAMGDEYRMVIYATDVEKATTSQRPFTVRPDRRLASLLHATLDDQIDRAVIALAKSVEEQTTIAVGRITYTGTETVSSLSAYLKNSVIAGAQKQQSKFMVASESESSRFAVSSRGLTVETPAANSSIGAVVMGSFSPVDKDAEVTFQLVSTGADRMVLGSTAFVIPATELERRKLSLLPEKNTAVISKVEFEQKQKAVSVYAGKDNRFTFTVTPDDLDGMYYDGEYMTMQIYTARDCYFRITHVDVNGSAQVIYPTAAKDNNFIRAGETRRIPDNTRFRLEAPFGEEYILVAAYDKPFTTSSGGSVPISDDAFARGIAVESETGNGKMSPVATAKFNYTILPRN